MKTKTFSILFALVMILSVSVGVFAQDSSWDETWDENTVLTVFSDVDMLFPDMFADEDSNFLWVDNEIGHKSSFDDSKLNPKSVDESLVEKAPVAGAGVDYAHSTPYVDQKFTYDPCGDGLIKFKLELDREKYAAYITEHGSNPSFPFEKYGPEKETFIRDIVAYVIREDGSLVKADLKKCNAPDNCHVIRYDSKGKAKLEGYLYAPMVLDNDDSGKYYVAMEITVSNYKTALFPVPTETVYASGKLEKNTKKGTDYCQNMFPYSPAPSTIPQVRAKYDENTGEARFQAFVGNFDQESLSKKITTPAVKYKTNYVIPADVLVGFEEDTYSDTDSRAVYDAMGRYTDYTCKYTLYNSANGAPRTDYCKFGEGIALGPNAVIRFDITIPNFSSKILNAYEGSLVPFAFRVGGMRQFVFGSFEAVDFPCPAVSRMQVMDPLHNFLFFKDMIKDNAIKASGPYGVYEGGLWGMYQKCGKMAYMAVRLKNDGIKDETINLDHTAVAINGGTPMKWNWVLSTKETWNNKIVLESGEDVTLILRAKVTDVPSQLNADTAMTGAVNFTDFGFYITGKVYSDHNNTNCVAAPK